MLKKAAFTLLPILLLFTMSCEQKPTLNKPATKTPPNTSEKTMPAKEGADTTQPNNEPSNLPNVTLRKGDKGDDVTLLQTALKKIGYQITIDGIYGGETATAILDLEKQISELDQHGIFDADTRKAMVNILDGKVKITPGKTITPANSGKTDNSPDNVVSDPTSILVLVNKHHRLPTGYVPPDLVEPNVPFPFKEKLEKRQLRKVAADALEKLFSGSESAGLHLYAQSGYRSYDRQKAIFASNARKYGEKEANRVSAYPGESEHQTGLTMDVTCPNVNFTLIEPFGTTAEGRWLKAHAHEYGFIIRYPKGKESITGYSYEPWHIRYVGVKVATAIAQKDLTFEEYLGKN